MRINKITFTSINPYEKFGFKLPERKDILPQKPVVKVDKGLVFGAAGLAAAGIAFGAYALLKNRRQDFGYIKTLAHDMSQALGRRVKTKQLDCIAGKKELHGLLKGLSEQNFIASPENMANGVFKADLHSHTWRSDGWGIVGNIMEEAAQYGDKLHAKTGKKFLFALTDHDGIQGVKEALELIVQDPKKYQNVRFVPGVELSFLHACEKGSYKFLKNGSQIEGSELLVHCINPYSKTLNRFIDNLQNSRANMIKNAIGQLGEGFRRDEMDEFYLKKPNENFIYNIHWRVLNYAQVKNRVNQIAQKTGQDPHELYMGLMNEWKIDKNHKCLDNFNQFLATKGIAPQTPSNNRAIGNICKKFFPQIEKGEITVAHENTFESLIKALEKEEGISAGFAHPAFLMQCFNDPKSVATSYVKRSKGLIQTTEKFHQGYGRAVKSDNMTREIIKNTNTLLDDLKLLPLGGHDNHAPHLFSQ